MRPSSLALVGLFAPLGASDCAPREPEPFECALGLTSVDGGFTRITLATTLELELGFQGFLIAYVGVRTEDSRVPDRVEGGVTLTPDGLDAAGGPFAEVPLLDDGTGGRITTPIQVFLDATQLGTYVGRTAHIAVGIEGDRLRCVAVGDVVLVDDDPCIHTGDEPICPDDDTDVGDSGDPP